MLKNHLYQARVGREEELVEKKPHLKILLKNPNTCKHIYIHINYMYKAAM